MGSRFIGGGLLMVRRRELKNKMEKEGIVTFGMISSPSQGMDVLDHFELTYETECEAIFIGKKEFTHDEEGLVFKYRYAILITDMEMMSGEDIDGREVAIELLMVISPESLHESAYKMIFDGIDYEMAEMEKYNEIVHYGCGIRFGVEYVDLQDDEELTMMGNIKKTVADIVETYEGLDGLRGFVLDRAWNIGGTTGWDSVFHYVQGRKLFYRRG